MKTLITIITLVCNIACTSCSANDLTDYQLMYKYCDENFSTYTVCVFTEWDDEVMSNRANTNVIYVEKCISYSEGGRYGYTEKGEYVTYNVDVPKGEKVESYFVYNPYTNYCDDILVAIDNQLMR